MLAYTGGAGYVAPVWTPNGQTSGATRAPVAGTKASGGDDMRVTFYSVRGSVPTPGLSTVLYGGNSACVEVRLADGSLIVLDGGTGIRDLGNQLLSERFAGRIHLLITHSH